MNRVLNTSVSNLWVSIPSVTSWLSLSSLYQLLLDVIHLLFLSIASVCHFARTMDHLTSLSPKISSRYLSIFFSIWALFPVIHIDLTFQLPMYMLYLVVHRDVGLWTSIWLSSKCVMFPFAFTCSTVRGLTFCCVFSLSWVL